MRLRQFKMFRFLGALAYRETPVPNATVGHKHRFVSFYLTRGLNLRTEAGVMKKAKSQDDLILWVVPPGMFHEWVADGTGDATVFDLTPLHRPHQLAPEGHGGGTI